MCSTGYSKNSTGSCVETSSNACSDTCKSLGGGTFNVALGICECVNSKVPIDQVCNSTCRLSASKISVSSTGQLIVTSSTGIIKTVQFDDTAGFSGRIASCPNTTTNCNVVAVVSYPDGNKGEYDIGPALKSKVGIENIASRASQLFSSSRKYKTMQLSVSSASPGYVNPTLCLKQGDAALFDLSIDHTHFPVYQKDSLLNSNPNFDYGAFRALAQQIAANVSIPNIFAYTFRYH